MWSISEVKKKGKASLQKNYWRCVLAALFLDVLTLGSSLGGSAGSTSSLEQYTQQLGLDELAPVFAIISAVFDCLCCDRIKSVI